MGAGSAVRRLCSRKRLPRALAPWAMDSGSFSELSLYGEWRASAAEDAPRLVNCPRTTICGSWLRCRTLTMKGVRSSPPSVFRPAAGVVGPIQNVGHANPHPVQSQLGLDA